MITFVSAALALLISFRTTTTSPFIENIKASSVVKAGQPAPNLGGLCDASNQATASFTESYDSRGSYETNGADLFTMLLAMEY